MAVQSPIDVNGNPATGLVSSTVNAQDGTAAGGKFSHVRIWRALDSWREVHGNQPSTIQAGMPSAYDAHPFLLKIGAQVEKRYTIHSVLPVGVGSGPLNGQTVAGVVLTIATPGGPRTDDTVDAQYLIPFSEMIDLNTAALKVVQLKP